MNKRYNIALLIYCKIVDKNLKISILNFNIIKFPNFNI